MNSLGINMTAIPHKICEKDSDENEIKSFYKLEFNILQFGSKGDFLLLQIDSIFGPAGKHPPARCKEERK